MIVREDLPRYPANKNSGVAWIGEVPEHWVVRRLRNCSEMRVSNIDKHTRDNELPVRLCNYMDVYKNNRIGPTIGFMRATATTDEIERFRLRRGDVLITKDSETWNDIGVPALVEDAQEDMVSGYHLALLRPSPKCVCGEYLFRALQSTAVAYQFHVEATGVTRYGLSHSAIKSVRLPVPTLPEQAVIARFLDHADRRIRRYIRAKQKLITLLEEQKQAIIYQAVTGQINVRTGKPYPAYRDSGVAWPTDVPEHWRIVRNGQIFGQRNETDFPDLPILEVSLRTGVRIRDFEGSDHKQMMTVRGDYKRAAKGDIAYNMMRMWQGAVGVAPVDGLVSPAYVVASPLRGTETRYFSALFRTSAYMVEVDKCSRGIVKDRNRLYWIDFKQMPSPCPPVEEQVRIADSIAQSMTFVGDRILGIEQQIGLIREYRARLISDVVTGKLDVREAAARLPDEIEESESLDGSYSSVDAGEEGTDDLDAIAKETEA